MATELTMFTAHPVAALDAVKARVGDEFKIVHLVRHAQGV